MPAVSVAPQGGNGAAHLQRCPQTEVRHCTALQGSLGGFRPSLLMLSLSTLFLSFTYEERAVSGPKAARRLLTGSRRLPLNQCESPEHGGIPPPFQGAEHLQASRGSTPFLQLLCRISQQREVPPWAEGLWLLREHKGWAKPLLRTAVLVSSWRHLGRNRLLPMRSKEGPSPCLDLCLGTPCPS